MRNEAKCEKCGSGPDPTQKYDHKGREIPRNYCCNCGAKLNETKELAAGRAK